MFTGSVSDPLYDLIHSADHCWWSEDVLVVVVEGVEEGCSLLVVDVLSVCISGYRTRPPVSPDLCRLERLSAPAGVKTISPTC